MRNVTIKFVNGGKEISEIKAEEVDLLEIVNYARKIKKVTSPEAEKGVVAVKSHYTRKGARGPQWTFHDAMIGINLLRKSPEAKNGRELIRLIRENGDANNRKSGGIRMMANRLYHYLYVGDPDKIGMSTSTIEMLKSHGIVIGSLKNETAGTKIPVNYRKEYLPSLNPKEA